MSSRHTDFHPGSLGRLTPANFDQSRPMSSTRQNYYLAARNSPPPQSDSSNSPPTTPRCITPPQSVSLLERHAISSYPARKAQRPLSVYELPTATYMWPRWNPREEEQPGREPVIFVKYRPAQCDTESGSSRSRPPSRSSYQASSSHPSPASTPPPASRKRSFSAESDDESVSSPSDRFLKHSRLCHNVTASRVVSGHSPSPRLHPVFPSYQPQAANKDSPSLSHVPSAESDYSDVEMPPAKYLQPPHQSNSTPGGANFVRPMAPGAVPPFAALRADRADDPRKDEWTKYTRPRPDSAGTEFECIWEVKSRDGSIQPCGYVSKKHLVKRHIESKHLQLRPCVCRFCGKGFAQKSNLDTHLNTHTRKAPHKCIYCTERFRDPARRHRHMIQAHDHVSSRTKKGRMRTDGEAGSSAETDAEDFSAEFTAPPPS